MTLVLELPREVDDRLQLDADRLGVTKESLAADIIARSVSITESSADAHKSFWSPLSFEQLAKQQGLGPLTNFVDWLANLPELAGADELAAKVESARVARRALDRSRS